MAARNARRLNYDLPEMPAGSIMIFLKHFDSANQKLAPVDPPATLARPNATPSGTLVRAHDFDSANQKLT